MNTIQNGFISKKPSSNYRSIFQENEIILNDELNRCSMRKNQKNVFDNYKNDNLVIIQEPGGSGKSTTIKFICSYKLLNNFKNKYIIIIPQHMIAKSFKKVELIFPNGEIIYWDINNNFCEKTSNGKVKELVNFINKPIVSDISNSIVNKVAITTYQSFGFAWDKLNKSEKENAIKNIGWFFDESHRIGLSKDGPITKVGNIISLGLKKQHLNPCFWLTSATQFRGDKCSIIPDEHYDKFKVDFLPLDKHWEENIKYIDSFSYDFYVYKSSFYKELKTALNDNKVPTLIICPPNNGKHGCKYKITNNIKQIVRDVYGNNAKILDFVHEKGRDQLKQEFLDGKHNDTDVILSVELMDEGVDWVKCAQVLDLNPSNSLRVQVQRIYRLWRDCYGKKEINYISFLRFCNQLLDEDNYKQELDKIIATWTGAMLIQDLISPINIGNLQKDNNTGKTSTGNNTQNSFQKAFPDVNKQDEVLNEVTKKIIILSANCEFENRKPSKNEYKECIEKVIKSFGITEDIYNIVNIIAVMFTRKIEINYGIDLSYVVDAGFETIWKDEFSDVLLKFGSNNLGKHTFQEFRNCLGIYAIDTIKQYNKLNQLVESKKGTLLVDKYINAKTKVRIQCEHGHQWNATPNSLFNGTWCPTCLGFNPIEQQNKLEQIVESKGGILLSDYVKSKTKVKVQCKHGHQWEITPSDLMNQGSWCPTCSGRNPIEQQKKLKETVESKGGILLSDYVKNDQKVRVQCKHGHQWNANPSDLFIGHWCPECHCAGKNKDYQQNKLEQIVKSKKGLLLSDYVNATTKVKVQCEHGHQWKPTPHKLFSGRWCPTCLGFNPIEQQKKLKETVESKGGLLLSEYVKNDQKVKVQCEHRHQWEATPSNLLKGTWCPICLGRNPIEQQKKLKKIVESKGGLLLSDYVKSNQKVMVQCEHRHQWEVNPDKLFNGTWCPKCAVQRRSKK